MKYLTQAFLLFCILLLAGCGSDSDKTSKASHPDTPDSTASKPEHFDVGVYPQAKTEGNLKVMLVAFDDKINQWLHSAEATEIDGMLGPQMPPGIMPDYAESSEYRPGLMDANMAGIYNVPQEKHVISLEQASEILATNVDGLGSGTARPDIFKDGHYSAFDLLRYLAITRDDLTLSNVVDWIETGFGTYTFDVSTNRDTHS